MFTIEQNGIGLAGWLVIIGGGITLAALVGGIIKMLKHLFLTAGVDQKKSEILAILLIAGSAAVIFYDLPPGMLLNSFRRWKAAMFSGC